MMANFISRQKAISKTMKSGTMLFLYNEGAIVKEFKKETCVSTNPIIDFHVVVKTETGEAVGCVQDEVQVLFSNKYQICWAECKKAVNEESVSDSMDGIVYEWIPLHGKIIITWTEKAYDWQENECTLSHYLTADISDNGNPFVHIEEMCYTKELLNDLVTVMAALESKDAAALVTEK